jgi:hypothetical protein
LKGLALLLVVGVLGLLAALASPEPPDLSAAQVLEAAAVADGWKRSKIDTLVLTYDVQMSCLKVIQEAGGSDEFDALLKDCVWIRESKAPDLSRSRFEHRGKRLWSAGYDGKTVWVTDVEDGLFLFWQDDSEGYPWNGLDAAEWRKHFETASLIRKERVADRACYVVALTPRGQKSPCLTRWYDEKTFRLVREECRNWSFPCCGKPDLITVTLEYEAWKSVEGIWVPGKIRHLLKDTEMHVLILKEACCNVKLENAVFGPPKGAWVPSREKP